ncbi:hypothetical protein ACFLZH_04400, partial [Patescibacteria group bacterium]
HAQKMTEVLDKIAEHEFEMLKTINEVKEVMWDMMDKRQKSKIEERMLRGAERYTGLPLKKGEEYTGLRREIKGWNADSTPIVEEFPEGWTLKDVFVDKQRAIDPEDPLKKQDMMAMKGVWVALESKNTGEVHRMSMTRLREFVTLHQMKPKIKNKKEFQEKLAYLNEMNIQLKKGMELEYDEWQLDEASQRRYPIPKKVKILYLDDKTVKLDQKINVHAPADNPDPANFVLEDEMELGDFARWLNRNRAVPTMTYDEIDKKLDEHYEYMNKEYKRDKYCHDPINLKKGEVIFADAPGNPLYQITDVDTVNGKVKLTQGLEFTFPQFLKWVYEYDMEPYKPELEGAKMKKYMKASDRSAKKAEEDAELAQDHFLKTGIWRDTLKKLREGGAKGIHEPEIKIKVDEKNPVLKQSHSYLRQFVKDTYVFALDDLFQMVKEGYTYYTRNWRRRQKNRYSAIGKGIPWFGTEFERVNQQAENEEVDQFKQAMDQWGIKQIEETLYATNNKDQAKACFNVLAEKGQLRWDERRLWEAINKHTDINHKIPLPAYGKDAYLPFEKDTGKKFKGMDVAGKSAIDFIPEALDSIWGESSYIAWKRQNDGALEDGIQKSFNKAEELESDPKNTGGIAKELAVLLQKHMRGEYVDPSEFEGMLRFIIEAGKAGGKDKIYYMLMGTSAKNPDGRTIMGWDRVGRFISKYSNQFPAMDFFSASNNDPKRDSETGEIFTRPWIKADFEHLTRPWIEKFQQTGEIAPPPEAIEFLWKEVLTSDAFQKRLEKGIRNANAIDHDDSPFFIPALKESEVESACASSGGETKKFTVQGYKNAYIGFGLRLQSLNSKYDEEENFEQQGQAGFKNQYLQKMVSTFQTYMKYDGILDNRYRRKEESRLQRFSSHDYRSGCVWDSERALQIYQKEMHDLIIKIATAYGEGDNKEFTETPFIRLASIRNNPTLDKEQKQIESAIENFGPAFEKMVMKDQGVKMLQIIEKKDFLANHVADDPEQQVKNKMKMEVLEGMRGRDVEEAVVPETPGEGGEPGEI